MNYSGDELFTQKEYLVFVIHISLNIRRAIFIISRFVLNGRNTAGDWIVIYVEICWRQAPRIFERHAIYYCLRSRLRHVWLILPFLPNFPARTCWRYAGSWTSRIQWRNWWGNWARTNTVAFPIKSFLGGVWPCDRKSRRLEPGNGEAVRIILTRRNTCPPAATTVSVRTFCKYLQFPRQMCRPSVFRNEKSFDRGKRGKYIYAGNDKCAASVVCYWLIRTCNRLSKYTDNLARKYMYLAIDMLFASRLYPSTHALHVAGK